MTTYPASTRGVDPVAERGSAPGQPPTAAEPVDVTDRLAGRSLLVIADPPLQAAVRAAFADGPPAVRTVDRQLPAGTVAGTAAIRDALTAHAPVDGVLLVVPRDADLATLPGPLVDGVPVGVVRADKPAGIEAWLDAVRPPLAHTPVWAVLAMGTDEFLEPAGTLRRRLGGLAADPASMVEVRDWRADRVDRPALCRRLATGPSLAVYLGHGRPNGWVGYQALRWMHVSAVPHRGPIGTVVALTCDALASPPSATPPFVERFVRTGRAGAALGPVGDVRTDDVERFSRLLGTVLRDVAPATVGDLLRELHDRAERASLAEHLASYRLAGSPLQPVR